MKTKEEVKEKVLDTLNELLIELKKVEDVHVDTLVADIESVIEDLDTHLEAEQYYDSYEDYYDSY